MASLLMAGWVPERLRGRLALARLATGAGARQRGFKSALWGGASIALCSSATIAWLAQTSATDATDILALRVLGYASWLFGGFGLFALLAPQRDPDGAAVLAAERGFDAHAVAQSWSLGVALRVGLGCWLVTAGPLLLSVALSPSGPLLAARALLLPLVTLYCAALGVTCALLARAARAFSPRRPRLTLCVVVFLPYLASFFFADVPSVPGVFAWALRSLIAVGGLA